MKISLPEVEAFCLKSLMNGLKETLMLLAQRQFIVAFEQSEKEVEDLRQRTREGFTLESRGKISESKIDRKITRPKSLDIKPKIKKLAQTFGGSCTDVSYWVCLPLLTLNIRKNSKPK